MGFYATITGYRNLNIDIYNIYCSYNVQGIIYDVEFEVLEAVAVSSSIFGM
jgi:hypothetical protein